MTTHHHPRALVRDEPDFQCHCDPSPQAKKRKIRRKIAETRG